MVNSKHLKSVSTGLIASFFTQSALRCLWQLQEHTSFVSAATSANQSLVKMIMVCISLTKLVATSVIVFPFIAGLRNGTGLACGCLAAASFVELSMNALVADNNGFATSMCIFATCCFRLLETLSSIEMRVYHGSIGQTTPNFDNLLGRVRDVAARYKAASTATILILGLLLYTASTTESTVWRTNSLKRQLALNTWSKTAGIISLLATLGAYDVSKITCQAKDL